MPLEVLAEICRMKNTWKFLNSPTLNQRRLFFKPRAKPVGVFLFLLIIFDPYKRANHCYKLKPMPEKLNSFKYSSFVSVKLMNGITCLKMLRRQKT